MRVTRRRGDKTAEILSPRQAIPILFAIRDLSNTGKDAAPRADIRVRKPLAHPYRAHVAHYLGIDPTRCYQTIDKLEDAGLLTGGWSGGHPGRTIALTALGEKVVARLETILELLE